MCSYPDLLDATTVAIITTPNAVHKHARSSKDKLVNDPGVLMSEHTRLALAKTFQECSPSAAGLHSDIQLVDSAP